MKIGEFLRSARKDKNITLRKLSEITDISFSQLGKIEREEHKPSKENLIKIANALEINVAFPLQLLGYDTGEMKTNIIDPLLRYKMFVRDELKCRICGAKAPTVTLMTDLIVPVDDGEEVNLENMVSLCEECFTGRKRFIEIEGLEKDFLFKKNKLRISLKNN
ncbi:helix-turn-helix domain-containing protein [Peribacillus glennii]|uniref:Helix-turn-helix domain-containing protein n=1 Tax=Peribacillus glennii TaxID=2303991 RepID=A0A372L785_9BACI|nr:helix-turn-helix domain-containing protein [Peribacillus glennii]RFU60738.1 helix-turn-helix domain-containing protein [Peribacillus glennii]